MFDLFRSRKQTVRIFLGAILLVVAASLVITLIPGLMSNPTAVEQGVFAEVGDHPVTFTDVQYQMRTYLRNDRLDAQSLRFLAQGVVRNLIGDMVLLEEADALGLAPDDEELAAWIKRQLSPGGVFIGQQQYEAFVRQRFQLSVPMYEEQLRRSLIIDVRLKRMLTDNVFVTDDELRDVYRRANEKAKFEFIKVSGSEFESQVEPTEQQLREHFEANKPRYRTQPMRSIKLMKIDDSQMPGAEIDDRALRGYYAQNRDRFEVPDRIRASHILFMTEGETEEELKESETEAAKVLEEVRAGADFAARARRYSEDPGTADKGGDLGWVTRGQMVPDFEKQAFLLEQGQISDVIKTEYGFHIIKVHERQNAQIQSFEEVKEEIRAELLGEQNYLNRAKFTDEAFAVARKHGKDLEAAGRELTIPVATFEKFSRAQPPAELSSSQNLLSAILQAADGEVFSSTDDSDVTTIVVVTEVLPPRDLAFDEVKEEVVSSFIRDESRRLAEERAEAVAAEAREANGNLRRVANRYRLRTRKSDFVTRRDSIPDLGSAGILGAEAFRAQPGTIEGPLRAGADWVVYRVQEQREADMSGFEEEREQLHANELKAKQTEAFEIYKAVARKRYEQEGKIRTHTERINSYLEALGRSR